MYSIMQRSVSSLRASSHAFTNSARLVVPVRTINSRSVSMGDAADEQVAKRAKVGGDEGAMEINNAVTLEYETKSLSEIAAAPITALQGIGPVTQEALKELGVETVTDLAENKCVAVPWNSFTMYFHDTPTKPNVMSRAHRKKFTSVHCGRFLGVPDAVALYTRVLGRPGRPGRPVWPMHWHASRYSNHTNIVAHDW